MRQPGDDPHRRHVGDRSFFPANAEGAAQGEVVAAFLEQHYLEQPMPSLIVTSEPVELENAITPSHGERKVWLDMARKNALLAIAQRGATAPRRKRVCSRCAKRSRCPKVRAHRVLRHQPHDGRSHGGSCVVYDRQQMQKSEYRRFNIRDVTPGDDYAAMRQVLARRYERVTAEAGRFRT